MNETALGLAIMAVVAAIIGYSMFRGSRAKPTTGDGSGDASGGGWDGSHGDGGGGDGGGGGD